MHENQIRIKARQLVATGHRLSAIIFRHLDESTNLLVMAAKLEVSQERLGQMILRPLEIPLDKLHFILSSLGPEALCEAQDAMIRCMTDPLEAASAQTTPLLH